MEKKIGITSIYTWKKEIKLSLFIDATNVYVKKYEKNQRKLLELISSYNKVGIQGEYRKVNFLIAMNKRNLRLTQYYLH